LSELAVVKREWSHLPRLFLLEDEYRTALLKAELTWLQGVIADLGNSSIAWNDQWLREIAAAFTPPE
jgi:hypothetical protein